MAKKNKQPQHVVEFKLKATESDIRAVNIKLDVARKLYNATLGEIFRRNDIMRASPEWIEIRGRYNAIKSKINACKGDKKALEKLEKARKSIATEFTTLRKTHGVTTESLNRFSRSNKNACYFGDHLDANTIQKIDKRAMDAFDRWCFGISGKPRFKGKNRAFKSIEGKTNKQGLTIRFGDENKGTKTRILLKSAHGRLNIPLVLDKKDKHGYQAAALDLIASGKVSLVRLIKRTYKGKERLYAQVVLKGAPFIKAFQQKQMLLGKGKRVGLDLGVSSLAYYSTEKAGLLFGVQEIQRLLKKLKHHQKKASRLLRLANKDNYEKVKKRKGRKDVYVWHRKLGTRDSIRPNSWMKEISVVKELHRKIAAKRKYLHDVYANTIVSLGHEIVTEKVSVKGWQRVFGQSISNFAPSSLISTIRRKAENAGGKVIEINTYRAKLSQYDHIKDKYIKKKLSDRVMMVGDTDLIQRDLYSAFLAYCVDKTATKVSRTAACDEWAGARVLLDAAFDEVCKLGAKRRELIPSSAGIPATRRALAV